jgi:hypothetical protein
MAVQLRGAVIRHRLYGERFNGDTDETPAGLRSHQVSPIESGSHGRMEADVMDSEQVEPLAVAMTPSRRTCLVEGCPCKDPRIVSHRRAAFFAVWAKDHGETANRVIRPDPGWNLAVPPASAA